MDNWWLDTLLIQVIGPVYDPQSVFFRTEKNAFYRFYKLKIGLNRQKIGFL